MSPVRGALMTFSSEKPLLLRGTLFQELREVSCFQFVQGRERKELGQPRSIRRGARSVADKSSSFPTRESMNGRERATAKADDARDARVTMAAAATLARSFLLHLHRVFSFESSVRFPLELHFCSKSEEEEERPPLRGPMRIMSCIYRPRKHLRLGSPYSLSILA